MSSILHRARRDEGVTLPELLVVISLMAMVVSVMYVVLNSTSVWADKVDARSVAAREMRLTTDQMTRELRQACEISDGDGVFAEAGARRCSFYIDLEHDRIPEKVTYYVDGTRIRRTQAQATIAVAPYNFGSDGPPRTLIGELQPGWTGDVFDYYDTDSPPAEVSVIPDISSVRIHIINEATVGREISNVDSVTWVKIRSVHNSISLAPIEVNCHG